MFNRKNSLVDRRADRDGQPRFEMAPMLDVVFLLLIFFLYQIYQSVNLKTIPVKFAALDSQQNGQGAQSDVTWVFVNKNGQYQLNNEVVTWEILKVSLLKFAGQNARDKRPVYLAVDSGESQGMNLWTKAVKVIDLAHQLNINLVIVGASDAK